MKRASLAVLFATLTFVGTAAADRREGEDPDHRSAFELARLGVHGGWFSGSKMVGYGSLQRYDGGVGAMDLDVTRFPHENIGFSFALGLGFASQGSQNNGGTTNFNYGRLESSIDFGLLSWSGPGKSGWSVGAGFGGAFGKNRYWYAEKGVGYPILRTNLRLWATRDVSLHAAYQWLPSSTGDAPVRSHRFEAAVGIGLMQLGARLELVSTQRGVPIRTYVDRETSLFVAFAVY